MEGFQAAFNMGADAVELDIIPTADGKLLVRHESQLELTTNITETENLRDRCTMDENGEPTWLAEHFTENELRALHARERYRELRPTSAAQNDLYMVPFLTDVFNDPRFSGKSFIVELKHAKKYAALGFNMVNLVEECVLTNALPHSLDISLESFDLDTCVQLVNLFPELRVIHAVDNHNWNMAHKHSNEQETAENFIANMESKGLTTLALGFDLLFNLTPDDSTYTPTQLFTHLQQSNLTVYGFTASDDLHKPETLSEEDYWAMLASSPLDGIFTDHPDKLRAALSA